MKSKVNVGDENLDIFSMGGVLERYFRPLIKDNDAIAVYI